MLQIYKKDKKLWLFSLFVAMIFLSNDTDTRVLIKIVKILIVDKINFYWKEWLVKRKIEIKSSVSQKFNFIQV